MFAGEIVSAIQESCGLVLVLTPGASQSWDVLQEVTNAHNRRKLIVPLVVHGTRPSNDLNYYLAPRHWLPWTNANAVAAQLGAALAARQLPPAPTQQARGWLPWLRCAVASHPVLLVTGVVEILVAAGLLSQAPIRFVRVPWQASASAVQDCDRLAQPPNMGSHYQPVSGVALDEINGKAAQEACERAMRKFPREVRFKAYLGRALESLDRLDEAVVVYRQAADQGNAVAQFSLAGLYDEGHNDVEAAKWYRQAADQKDVGAAMRIASMYEQGRGVPQDYWEAANSYRVAAQQGNAEGQVRLGGMYEIGRGVPQSYREAANWYRRAAARGNAEGQVRLGRMYETGRGVRQDDWEAAKWYGLAGDQGLAAAQFNLGAMYENGLGVSQSNTEAVKWYRLAAMQGYQKAQKALELMGQTP
jgi:TPR repeat protein